jgi:hypothetical protein
MEAVPVEEDEEPLTPIGEFLKPLGLDQHRGTMRQLGFDSPATDFKAQTPDDAQDMKAALLEQKVPLGHVAKIMRSASALRPSTSSAPPLDQQLQPVSDPELLAGGVVQLEEPTWARSLGMPVTPASAEQRALIQTSLDQATVRREKEHQDKVCQGIALEPPNSPSSTIRLHPHPYYDRADMIRPLAAGTDSDRPAEGPRCS